MNKWWLLLVVMVCWAGAGFALFGRQQQSESATGLSSEPERIVSMAPNLTEILFALGLGEKIVGVAGGSDYPPAAVSKPKMGSFWQPNIEAVIAAKPDVVITLGFNQQRSLAQRLKRIGYNGLTVNIEKVSELFEAIGKIGEATGRGTQAGELVRGIRGKLDNLSALVGAAKKIKVLWVVQREPLRVAGKDTFINEMIELASGENAIGQTVHKYPPIGAEQVYTCGAEVIIEPVMIEADPAGQQAGALKYWSRFRNVGAVKNNRVYVVDGDIVSRLGPRLYEGVEAIARCLRPELFEN
jgi:iron complex transport system substrate-binding protein